MNGKFTIGGEALPEGLEQMTPEELKDLITSRIAKTSYLAEKATAAYNAYFADVNQQVQQIRAELQKLQVQRSAINQAKEAEMGELVKLTIAGDTEGMQNQRQKLNDLEVELFSINGQIEGFQSYAIHGSEALKDAAFAAADELGEDGVQMSFFCENVKKVARKHFEMWKSVVDLHIESPKMPDVEKIGEHFHQTSMETAKDAIEALERREATEADRQRRVKMQEERLKRAEEEKAEKQAKKDQAIIGRRVQDQQNGRIRVMQVDPTTGEEIGPMPKEYLGYFAR